uniref:Receptor kinase-like protein Xa21 n=2 Tax=Leersia perrieri TaxID=77586 RepID=A0A0D9Y1M6_9ORYZ
MAVDVVFAAVEQGGWGSSAGFRHHDGDGSQRRRHGQPLLQLSKTATRQQTSMGGCSKWKSQCLLIMAFFIHAVHVLPICAAQSSDEQTLLEFKAAISSDPNGVLDTWVSTNGSMNATDSICRWHGVSCNSQQHPGRVTALELMSSNLMGVISPSLVNLSFLHTLNLSNNRISGGIPSELGHLPRIRVISLGGNSLIGSIPASLTNCVHLTHLELSQNILHGEILANFSNCRDLRVFNVSVNSLSGGIPASFGSLSKLQFLGLHRSNLTGGIPLSLGNMSSLLAFDASENYNLGGSIPDTLDKLTKLYFLRLASAGLSGAIPASLFNISSLRTLDLGNNDLSGNATELRVIQLQSNSLQGIVPSDIGRLKDLAVLNLQFNQLEDKWDKDWPLMTALGNCSRLFALSLSSNKFQGVLPASLVNLTIGIQRIYINANRISGAIPLEIGKFRNLDVFVLADNALTGTIPDTIGDLHSMTGLDISGNKISGEIPPMLVANLSKLAFLDLSENNLQGSIPESFQRMSSIAILDLSYNRFSGMLPKQVLSLSSLTLFLNLSHNTFSGPIPSEVGKLSSLGILDLSDNRLSGEIPQALAGCQSMEYLFLQGNQLVGRIPQSLVSLKGLQHLDMSQNNLSGPIPDFFATFQYLRYLNLSYNQLDGAVPTTGVFNDTKNFFVTGNRVCGGVSELQLPKCPDRSGKGSHRSRTVLIVLASVGSVVALVLITGTFFICVLKPMKQVRQINDTSLSILREQHWKLSYAELHRATDGFSAANLIGVGSFGSVYKGILGSEEEEVAIKVLNLLQHGAERSFLAECEVLRSVRHRNLVKVITACSTVDNSGDDFKALVYEFMPNRDLDKWLHPTIDDDMSFSRVLSMSERVRIALDVAEALDYLHHHGQAPIVHCDLKPSNVLLDDDMVAHVGDFGLSRFVLGAKDNYFQRTSISVGIKGTVGYIPPEYGMGGEISVEGDVYSYGILLLEMFTAKRPTDDLFQGGRSIRNYVATAYPDRVMEIVDQSLLQLKEKDMSEKKMEICITSVLRVALQCTEHSPRARMLTGDIIRELISVRDTNEVAHLPECCAGNK